MKIKYSYFFSPLIASVVSCSFLFSSFFLLVYGYVHCAATYPNMCTGVHGCVLVCAGVSGCERV